MGDVRKLLDAGYDPSGQSNGKRKKKIDYSNPPKLKRASTKIFKTGVKKMGDVRKLLDAGYDPNLQTQKSNSGMLHLAANSVYVGQLPSLALVEELLSRKANPDIVNSEGFRPLHIACGLPQDTEGNEQVAMA